MCEKIACNGHRGAYLHVLRMIWNIISHVLSEGWGSMPSSPAEGKRVAARLSSPKTYIRGLQ